MDNPEELQASTTVKDLKLWVASEQPNNPYNLNRAESSNIDKVGIVEERPISPKAEFVVTEQLQKSQDDMFTCKRLRDETSEDQIKRQ